MTAAGTLNPQQRAMPVIGMLGGGSSGAFALFVAAFDEGLSETGYVEGQNIAIEHRCAEGNYDRLPTMAADLVGRKVDVIIAMGGTPSALAAKKSQLQRSRSYSSSPTRPRPSRFPGPR